MIREALVLVLCWVPFWVGASLVARPRRPAPVLAGTALAALVGSLCCVELRRHGVLASVPDPVVIPPFGLHLHDVVRFASIGAGGALAADAFLSRTRACGGGG